MNSIEQFADDDELDFIGLCRLLWEYKFIIAALTLVTGAIAAGFAYTATPIYRASVIVTEVRDQNVGGAAALVGQLGGLASLAGVNLGGADGASREAQAILQSRHLIEEFIKRHNLLPQLVPVGGTKPTLWRGVRQFRSQVLSIREDARKGITTIDVDFTDPATAARWANDYVALANELIRTRALNNANRNIAYLNDQIAGTRVVELQRVMYNIIESETKTLMLAHARPEYAFTVVDPAVPPEIRSSPKRTVIILIGLVAGFVIGTVIASIHRTLARRRLASNLQGNQ